MCASCGCGKLHEDHGDPKNITLERLQEGALACGVTIDEAVANIERAVQRCQTAAGAVRQLGREAPSQRREHRSR